MWIFAKIFSVFAVRNETTPDQIDADKITRAQLNVASWYFGGIVTSLRNPVVRLGSRMNGLSQLD
jgi:hypothetical protein